MAKVIETKIDKLIPDDKNFNKGTEYGQHLIETSMRKFGAGRSILLDKNNRIIAGNKATENAGAIGIDDVIIVESDGTKLIAVKRTDIDLDTEIGRELALADNATSKANLSWDEEIIHQLSEQFNFDAQDWGVPEFVDSENEDSKDEGKKEISTKLIVECGDAMRLSLLFSELQDRGFVCELKE